MDKYWIWFSRINSIGAKKQNELLEKYKTPKTIWNLHTKELEQILTKQQIDIVLNKRYRDNLNKYIEYMQKNNIKLITKENEKYPQNLLNIYDPPVVLYLKGNENILNEKSIAIIGSRNCSSYGTKVARSFAYNLSKKNINIISGLARGIDISAHIGTLQAKGKTIAVMGNGLDTVYPNENTNILNQIIEKEGAVISEYIIGTRPEKKNFPARNRIISGISEGVLIVEAHKKSGALITVDLALEQGKDIYTIPGNIDSPSSERNK